MSSTSKCEYCGSTVRSDQVKCPNCDAPNPLYVVDNEGFVHNPKTIAELQEFCAERGMPLLRMRFFIGEDVREPKAFGIYRNSDGNFIVYKNKSDGTRNVRYNGPDEGVAVGEIYNKLIDECHKRGIYPENNGQPGRPTRSFDEQMPRKRNRQIIKHKFLFWVIIFVLLVILCNVLNDDGYYQYGSSLYYNSAGTWYEYDNDYYDWYPAGSSVSDLWDSSDDYYLGNSWSDVTEYDDSYSYGYSFEDSDYYDSGSSWDSDWDSDWSSSSYDSWDSGGSDWGSDW